MKIGTGTAFTTGRPNAASDGASARSRKVGEADTIETRLQPFPARATAAISDREL